MKKLACAFLAVAVLSACHGAPYQIPMQKSGMVENTDYKAVGETEGTASGFLLFAIIPIMKNDMIDRAFTEALTAKGGDFLLKPTVEERWYWTPIGNGFITSVKGTAVKIQK